MYNLFYGHMFDWGFGGIMMLVFWGAIIWFIVWLVKEHKEESDKNNSSHDKSAMDILKERYAKGEINKEEFEEKKKDLNS